MHDSMYEEKNVGVPKEGFKNSWEVKSYDKIAQQPAEVYGGQLSFFNDNEKIRLFKNITNKMVSTYASKNSDYGDSFTKVRKEYPSAIIIRLMDKLERLKTLYKDPSKQLVSSESIEDTLLDLATYAVMELVETRCKDDYCDE